MDFDPNSWYRLDTLESNHTRALKWCTGQIVCFSDTNLTDASAQWQLIPFDTQSTATTTSASSTSSTTASSTSSAPPTISLVSIRNRALGNDSAVGVSLSSNGTTQASLSQIVTQNAPAQLWNFVFFDNNPSGQPIFFVRNVLNGSYYNLATSGQQVFMTQVLYFVGSNQGWLATKVDADGNLPRPVSPTPSSPSSPASTSGTSQSGGSHISGGAIAGAVIGALAGVAILIILAILLLRRKRRQRRPKISNPIPIEPEDTPKDTSEGPASLNTEPVTEAKKEEVVVETPRDRETVDGRVELPEGHNQVPFSRYELP